MKGVCSAGRGILFFALLLGFALPPKLRADEPNHSTARNWLFTAIGLQYANNSALATYTHQFAQELATNYNAKLVPAGFKADPALNAAPIFLLIHAEYRR
ncbi:MAG: hypothetical protein N2Z22_10240, partial [Turneriella sp.]|nr:hypothetical protein [Turneriella sp.]